MFYRRKIILALLQIFDGQLDKIRLQKLLFLFSQNKTSPEYNFIPYRFGCYSYSANADMLAMVRKGLLLENEKSFQKLDESDYLTQIKLDDNALLQRIKKDFGNMNSSALMRYTYLEFPFYATKSEVVQNVLTKEELAKIKLSRPKVNETILFTIGYEGISLEEYLCRLIKEDVKILIDVRNNPMSMKFGFNRNQLKKYCESVDIAYKHIPEVGIQSEFRQELKTQNDYDKLFDFYRKENLTRTTNSQFQIIELLKQEKRIALTCFEANINQCHRKHLAQSIANLNHNNFYFPIVHI